MVFDDRLEELTPEQRELFELFLKREHLSLSDARRYRAPSNATEEVLARVWTDLLGGAPGVDDNYFELGGDSITIIRMVSQARAAGVTLRGEWVFSHPTIAGLASLARLQAAPTSRPGKARATADVLADLREADPDFERGLRRRGARAVDAYPLSHSQQGMLYHALERRSEGCYAVRWRFRLRGRLDLDRFRDAWKRMLERHEALRTSFRWVGVDEPMQVVLDRAESAPALGEVEGDWRAAAARVFEEERRSEFDLHEPPLMRIRFLRLADDDWLCFWTHHHLILDGWAQQVFLGEFFAAYRGQALPAPATGVLREHVHWLRSFGGEDAAEFWRARLSGYRPPSVRLTERASGVHATRSRAVPDVARVREALRREGLTPSVMYQACWAVGLALAVEQNDVVFGVTCSGRSSGAPGIENAVGTFINTLPLRLTLEPSLPLSAFLRVVQDAQAGLLQHEWCSLLAVQNWIAWDRRLPLVESLYVYERFPLRLAQFEDDVALRIEDVETTTQEHYPLVLVVQDEDGATTMVLKHAASRAEDARRFEWLLDFVASVPSRWLAAPDLTLREIMAERPQPRDTWT